MEELHSSDDNEAYITDMFLLTNSPRVNGFKIGFYVSQFSILLLSLVAHILAIIAVRRAKRDREMLDSATEPYVDVHTLLFKALLRVDLTAILFFICRALLSPTSLFSDNSFRCNVDSASGIFFSWAPGLINILLFLERSLALRTPYAYRKHATPFKAKMAVVFMVSFALFVCLLPVIGFGSYDVMINGGVVCLSPGDIHLSASKYHIHFTILFLTVGFCIILSIVSGNVVVIFYLLRLRKVAPGEQPIHASVKPSCSKETAAATSAIKKSQEMTSRTTSPQPTHDIVIPNNQDASVERAIGQDTKLKLAVKFSREVSTAIVLTCISIAYMISWIPLYTERLLTTFSVEVPSDMFYLAIWLLSFNHVIDPFIFVLLKKKNRHALKLFFNEQCRCGSMVTSSDTSGRNDPR